MKNSGRQGRITASIKKKFRFSTLNFIFIIAYVNIFQLIFGPENSIVGVIFTILMSASMARDMTGAPLWHLVIQSLILVWMAAAAFLVSAVSAPYSFIIHFTTLLVILYAFTYEYSGHRYFPYVLSYLFLIFISPVNAEKLPVRMISMLAGAASILLYQLFMGRKRMEETARDVLTEMIDDICGVISCGSGKSASKDIFSIHRKLCRLSRTVYERRKKILYVSDASCSMIDTGRGLEHLMTLLQEIPAAPKRNEQAFLENCGRQLGIFRSYLHQEITELPRLNPTDFRIMDDETAPEPFCDAFSYIRDSLLHMTNPQSRTHTRRSALSLKVRLQAALDICPVRAIYALRTALLLSLATLLVQSFALPHGKWLLFSLASLSLPYADDVPAKLGKRILATVTGGLISVAVFSLIPSSAGRTAVMMLSGYVSFYLTDYAATFACSTVGALGGAVFMGSFGLPAVSGMFLIRLGYVLAGALTAYLANCVLLPYSRARATRHLWKQYRTVTEQLAGMCSGRITDAQLYYHLVIRSHLLEEKLAQNAALEHWTEYPARMSACRKTVRQAHRLARGQI